MITKYSFSNYRSFYDTAIFDMIASPTKVRNRYPNNFIQDSTGMLPLKTSVIVGENAGGKSNFIGSLNFLKNLFKENVSIRSIRSKVNVNNIRMEENFANNTLQKYELEVIINGSLYEYNLEIDYVSIVKEKLSVRASKSHKKKVLMDIVRSDQDITENRNKIVANLTFNVETSFPSSFDESLKTSINNNPGYGLFVTRLGILGEEHALTFTTWMNETLYAEAILLNYDLQRSYLSEEDDLQILKDERYLEILRMVDYSIVGYELDEEKPYTKTIIIRKKEDGSFYKREIMDDSSGVREFFAWAVQIFRVVYEDKVIFADEMDRVLNPILSDRVMSYINGSDHRGQFIITTHNVMHLDFKNMMKEQMYFVTKDKESLNSEIYSLADFPEIRYETTKIYEFYMKGVLGGTSYA